MSLELTGRITFIGDVEVISDKFSKRLFVLEIADGNYTKKVALQFVNDKTSKLDGIQIGSEVTVKFNIESRDHNGKWFTNLTAWYLSGGQVVQGATSQPRTYNPSPENKDDLPF